MLVLDVKLELFSYAMLFWRVLLLIQLAFLNCKIHSFPSTQYSDQTFCSLTQPTWIGLISQDLLAHRIWRRCHHSKCMYLEIDKWGPNEISKFPPSKEFISAPVFDFLAEW